jgi:hypothetical protein
VSAADIRAWAARQGLECPARGRIPSHVEAAYWQEHQPPLGDPAPVDDDAFTLSLQIPGVDDDLVAVIRSTLLDAVWYAFSAGQKSERARLADALGVDR